MPVRRIAVLLILLLALGAVPAAAATPPSGCPAIMRTSEVREGMTGTGLTVLKGEVPTSFGIEVLGVLENAVAPGRDLIIVEANGAGVDEHGIWAGMSGSPVTVDGKLIGAVAYGLTFGPSQLAGLTPAEDLIDVLTLGDTTSGAMSTQSAENPAEMRQRIAEREDMSPQAVGSSWSRLKTPLSVSGVSQRSLQRLTEAIERAGMPLIPYLGGSAGTAAATTATATPRPGGNLAAALSYGDVTAAAVGTTTYVCQGRAVGFGHPFLFTGPAALGANDADAITIVTDPSFGSYKLASVGAGFGTVDQDRLGGIRLDLGAMPDLAPITSEVTSLETGRSRSGRTDVASGELMPFLAFVHALSNFDATVDRIGAGSAEMSWSAEGLRQDGSTWRLRRDNRFSSPGDIAIESLLEVLAFLSALGQNPFEDVAITEVDVEMEADDAVRRYTVSDVLLAAAGGEPVSARDGQPVFVEPGGVIDVTAVLEPYRSPERVLVTLQLQVPDDAFGDGFLNVAAGSAGFDPFVCVYDPQACAAAGGSTFDDLLKLLDDAPRNDELVASLVLHQAGGPVPPKGEPGTGEDVVADEPVPGGGQQAVASARTRLDEVATGSFGVPVFIGGAAGVQRLAGTNRVATAVELSRFTHAGGADTVVVARADQPADSLAAAPLAASLGAPLLLSAGDALSPEAAEEVRRLGASRAVMLGGQQALSSAVAESLKAAGAAHVERVAGTSRYDPARLVAERVGASQAVLVNGDGTRGWSDAVTAAAHAAASGRALLLASSQGLPAETAAALDAGMRDVLAVGGPAALPERVLAAAQAHGASVRRVAGADRYDTAVLLARESEAAGADGARTWIASGHSWADALAAGAAAAADGGVLVLTDPGDLLRSAPTADWLRERTMFGMPQVRLAGGFAAISGMVEQQIVELLFGGVPEPRPGEPKPGAPDGPAYEEPAYG